METAENIRDSYLRSYGFAEPAFFDAAFAALEEGYGPCTEWTAQNRYHVRIFLSALSVFTPENLTLSSLKESFKCYPNYNALHRPAFFFLKRIGSLYRASDRNAYREVVRKMAGAGRSYRILFDPKVGSFNDIAILPFKEGGQHFYIIDSKTFAGRLLRDFVTHFKWASQSLQRQTVFDQMYDIMNGFTEHRFKELTDIDSTFIFYVMDTALALSTDERNVLVYNFIRLVRFCVVSRGLKIMEAPFSERNVVMSTETVRFFVNEYDSRQKTFLFRKRGQRKKSRLVTLYTDNAIVRSVIGRLLGSATVADEDYNAVSSSILWQLSHVSTIEDFNEQLLFDLITYYSVVHKDNLKRRSNAVTFIKYLFLSVNEQRDGAFFRESNIVTYGLLTTSRFVNYCLDGYEFRVYSPFDREFNKHRVVFIVRDFDRMAKKHLKEDYIAVDFSCIHNPYYRSLAWRAVTSKPGRMYRVGFAYTLRKILPLLRKVKRTPGWKTPDQKRISIYDAILLCMYVEQTSGSVLSYNNTMQYVRDFFRWAEDANELTVEPLAFDSMYSKKVHNKPTNTPVPKIDDLAKIFGYMMDRAEKDPAYAQALIICNLMSITPLRAIQLVSLKRKEVVYDNTLNSYVINASNKTSGGNIDEMVLGFRADKLISKAFKVADKVSLGCTQEDLREYLFIYQERGHYSVFTTRKVTKMLNEACEACGVTKYGSKNLRAAYMTGIYLKVNEGSDGEINEYDMKVHSFHRNIKTTLEYYVNHDESLAALTDAQNRGVDWQKMIVPDEVAAIDDTIAELQDILDDTADAKGRGILEAQIQELKNKRVSLRK